MQGSERARNAGTDPSKTMRRVEPEPATLAASVSRLGTRQRRGCIPPSKAEGPSPYRPTPTWPSWPAPAGAPAAASRPNPRRSTNGAICSNRHEPPLFLFHRFYEIRERLGVGLVSAKVRGPGRYTLSRNHVRLGGNAHVGVDGHHLRRGRRIDTALERRGSARIDRCVGLRLPRCRLGRFGERSVDQLDLALGQPFVRSGGGQRAELRPVMRYAILVLGPDLQDPRRGRRWGFYRAFP